MQKTSSAGTAGFFDFAGAFRRSELVALDRADVEFTQSGLVITLRRSKTDPEGQGRKLGIPYGVKAETCPVRALESWLQLSGISSGPLFRAVNRHGSLQSGRLSDKAVALVGVMPRYVSFLDIAALPMLLSRDLQ